MNTKLEKSTPQPWILGEGAEILESAGVSAAAVQALQVFAGALSDVEFPGASAELLEQHARAVGDTLKVVEEAQAAITAARAKLTASVATLERAAERGLAYARIYAEDDARVRQALEGLTPAKPKVAGLERKRKGRPPSKRPAAEAGTEDSGAAKADTVEAGDSVSPETDSDN